MNSSTFIGFFTILIDRSSKFLLLNLLLTLLNIVLILSRVSLLLLSKFRTCTLRKNCPYSEFFWSEFSRIRTEHGEIRSTLLIQSERRKIEIRRTPNTDTFQAVAILQFLIILTAGHYGGP